MSKLSNREKKILLMLKSYGSIDDRELFCCCKNYKTKYAVVPLVVVTAVATYKKRVDTLLPEDFVISISGDSMHIYQTFTDGQMFSYLGRVALDRIKPLKQSQHAWLWEFLLRDDEGKYDMFNMVSKRYEMMDAIVDAISQAKAN